MELKELTTSETLVMKCIWESDHEMALSEIVEKTNEKFGTDSIYISGKIMSEKLY